MEIKKITEKHKVLVDELIKVAFQPYQAIYRIKPTSIGNAFSFESIGVFIEERLVAVLSYYQDANMLRLFQIAVHPEQQGKGFFSVLLAHAEQIALHKGLSKVGLYTIKQTKAYAYFKQKQFIIIAQTEASFAEPVQDAELLIEYEMHKDLLC